MFCAIVCISPLNGQGKANVNSLNRSGVSQLSASAEYQVKSADERIQIAQMEGVNARLQVMGLEAEMEEKDNEIALLKEYFGTD